MTFITETSSITPLNIRGRATFTPTSNFNYPGWPYDAANYDDKFTTYYSNAVIPYASVVDIFF